MTALISGSMAYDTIMVFHDRFRNHILPDKVHMLNVAFLVPDLRREFGGCAGNIAYNLKLLGGQGKIMATVGDDIGPYAEWMQQQGIDQTHIRKVTGAYTAQAYITTDMDDNQITAFHPGAMNESHLNRVSEAEDISIGIVAPAGKQGMLDHAQQFADCGIPFIFDPGQGLPMFDAKELSNFINLATWVAVNDYESQLLQEKTGQSLQQLAANVEALVVTRGGQGSQIYTDGQCIEIPTATPESINDPTGCGDAYRAGLLYGLMNNHDWETTGRIASLMGAIKIESHGTQNHHFDRSEFEQRFQDAFGRNI
ncbi:MAG: carbohydrate kinase family protein [Gammaproteobacteria bacterium]|nr:MAG: carbohydrate kinase family protein [Gammaproteobacteria bacterium]